MSFCKVTSSVSVCVPSLNLSQQLVQVTSSVSMCAPSLSHHCDTAVPCMIFHVSSSQISPLVFSWKKSNSVLLMAPFPSRSIR